jgi:hypothetical protein
MWSEVPMPAVIAARPRDERGYPVPAITPWAGGVPQFASTGVARTFLCAVERRCSICGTEMPDGPVWRVVGGAEADAIATDLASGRPYRNAAPTAEAPGHRACMLYACAVCPYLARPNARRSVPASVAGWEAARGDARGTGGALAGFAEYRFEYSEADGVRFGFATLVEFRRYEIGAELLTELTSAPGTLDHGLAASAPAYLLEDEAAAQREFSARLRRLLG